MNMNDTIDLSGISADNARFFLSPRPQRDFTAWVEPTALQ